MPAARRRMCSASTESIDGRDNMGGSIDWGVPFVGVLVRALPFGVYIRTPDFFKNTTPV